MSFINTIVFICVLVIVPGINTQGTERAVRLINNVKQLITNLQEENENHKRELNDVITQKTDELKELILEQLDSLSDLPSEIVSSMKAGDGEGEEKEEEMVAKGCPLQNAMLSFFNDNPNSFTEELASRLDREMECTTDEPESHEEENCSPVTMNPDDTVELFKIKARARGVCTNPEPVHGLNTCQGGCKSISEYKDGGRRMRIVTTCSCCQPARFEKIHVDMTCNNGFNFTKNFDNIAECRCLRCGKSDAEDESD